MSKSQFNGQSNPSMAPTTTIVAESINPTTEQALTQRDTLNENEFLVMKVWNSYTATLVYTVDIVSPLYFATVEIEDKVVKVASFDKLHLFDATDLGDRNSVIGSRREVSRHVSSGHSKFSNGVKNGQKLHAI